MIHAITMACIQFVAYLLGWNLWGTALFFSAWYIGREIAQAEYRYIERRGSGVRSNMPWWKGLDVGHWTMKSVVDALLPAIVGFGLAWLAYNHHRLPV